MSPKIIFPGKALQTMLAVLMRAMEFWQRIQMLRRLMPSEILGVGKPLLAGLTHMWPRTMNALVAPAFRISDQGPGKEV